MIRYKVVRSQNMYRPDRQPSRIKLSLLLSPRTCRPLHWWLTVTARCFSHAGSNGTVIIAIAAAIVILMIALVITPVILVCLFNKRQQRKKTIQLDFTSEDPTSLTPCAAYGVHTHGGSTLPGEYKVPSLHSIPGRDPQDPDYEMITYATTSPHSVPGNRLG